MSEAEYASLMSSGQWTSAGTMEGKWFATTYDDAVRWANEMSHGGDTYRIVQVTVPDSIANAAHLDPRLDGIGPAAYFENDVLNDNARITWSQQLTYCCGRN